MKVLEWLYPDKCALCGLIGEPAICPQCLKEFPPHDMHLKYWTGSIDFALSIFGFDGRAAQAVKRLKYERVTSLGIPMSALMADALEHLPSFDTIVPVPIHWTRRAVRGFNQSELLCRKLSNHPIQPFLAARNKKTRPQVELSLSERLRNLDNAFDASPEARGKKVLLIDDVLTTGGTAMACGQALKLAGASAVGILTFCGEKTTLTFEHV